MAPASVAIGAKLTGRVHAACGVTQVQRTDVPGEDEGGAGGRNVDNNYICNDQGPAKAGVSFMEDHPSRHELARTSRSGLVVDVTGGVQLRRQRIGRCRARSNEGIRCQDWQALRCLRHRSNAAHVGRARADSGSSFRIVDGPVPGAKALGTFSCQTLIRRQIQRSVVVPLLLPSRCLAVLNLSLRGRFSLADWRIRAHAWVLIIPTLLCKVFCEGFG